MQTEPDLVDRIRAFNRLYTARMRLLGRSYLGSGRTLAEVRVLHDLASGETTARALAGRLGIDEGQLSRMLARMDRAGWLDRQADAGDGRAKRLSLTPAGAAEAAEMRRRSREEVAEVLAALSPGGAEALDEGLAAVTAALGEPAEVRLRDLEPGDLGWIVMEHGRLYSRDEGYDSRFEALVARILADFAERRDPATERGWIAQAGGRRLGCIFCVREDATTARLRLFLLQPEARGRGLGRRLLETCMGFARDAGYRRMVLWTHESHRAACALYARSGWRMTSSLPGRAFGQDVVDQEWEVDLGA